MSFTIRQSPSGPNALKSAGPQTVHVAAIAAGATATVEVPCPGAKVGDVVLLFSASIAAKGVIPTCNGCLVDGFAAISLTAVPAYVAADEVFAVSAPLNGASP